MRCGGSSPVGRCRRRHQGSGRSTDIGEWSWRLQLRDFWVRRILDLLVMVLRSVRRARWVIGSCREPRRSGFALLAVPCQQTTQAYATRACARLLRLYGTRGLRTRGPPAHGESVLQFLHRRRMAVVRWLHRKGGGVFESQTVVVGDNRLIRGLSLVSLVIYCIGVNKWRRQRQIAGVRLVRGDGRSDWWSGWSTNVSSASPRAIVMTQKHGPTYVRLKEVILRTRKRALCRKNEAAA